MKKRRIIGLAASYLISVVVLIVFVGPFVWLVISSISPEFELKSVPVHWFPEHPTFANYIDLLKGSGQELASRYFVQSVRNSLIVAVVTTSVCLFVGSFAAYAFSRMRFRGKQPLLILILLIQLLPTIAIIIPLFLIVSKLNLLDSRMGLILVYCSFTLPYIIWTMKGYFDTIPVSLEEAAEIDGCSKSQALFHIVLPLSKPGLIAAAIFSILSVWSEFLIAVVFTSTEAAKTIPVVISEFESRFTLSYGMMAAASVIASVPPIIFGLLTSKHLVGGLAAGGVKE